MYHLANQWERRRTGSLLLKIAAKYGFMGKYNRNLEISPFERFQLGDAGMSNSFGVLGYDIIAHRGYPIYQNSNPSINPSKMYHKHQDSLPYLINTSWSCVILLPLTLKVLFMAWHFLKQPMAGIVLKIIILSVCAAVRV